MGQSYKDFLGKMERYPAGRAVKDLVPGLMKKIDGTRQRQVSNIGNVWKEIVGERVALAAIIEQFKDGVLYVKVSSAALYSELLMFKKGALVEQFKEKLPTLGLINIVFRR